MVEKRMFPKCKQMPKIRKTAKMKEIKRNQENERGIFKK